MRESLEAAQRALRLDSDDPHGMGALSLVQAWRGEVAEAMLARMFIADAAGVYAHLLDFMHFGSDARCYGGVNSKTTPAHQRFPAQL